MGGRTCGRKFIQWAELGVVFSNPCYLSERTEIRDLQHSRAVINSVVTWSEGWIKWPGTLVMRGSKVEFYEWISGPGTYSKSIWVLCKFWWQHMPCIVSSQSSGWRDDQWPTLRMSVSLFPRHPSVCSLSSGMRCPWWWGWRWCMGSAQTSPNRDLHGIFPPGNCTTVQKKTDPIPEPW